MHAEEGEDDILRVEHLCTRIKKMQMLSSVDLRIRKKEICGLVGESGCGKSMTALSLTALLPAAINIDACTKISFDGKEMDTRSREALAGNRGRGISYIFQEPTSFIDPLFTIGEQISETVRCHMKGNKKKAKERALELLEWVEMTPAAKTYGTFPHQLSGGMNQRAMMAMALASHPRLLVADEPTTALDVLIEDKIALLIKKLVSQMELSVLWITHDISLIRKFADSLVVMYAGRILERGNASDVYNRPAHPYTQALLDCLPGKTRGKKFKTIKGDVVDFKAIPSGCPFSPRCPFRLDQCDKRMPDFFPVQGTQETRCYLWQKT